MAPDAGKKKKKKRGFGGLLSSKGKEDVTMSDSGQPPPVPPKDTHNTASMQNAHITPIVNDDRIPEVDNQRNLAVNEQTGEVLDDDTGEVLTVTTTTTTVTKTETRRGRSPQPPVNGNSSTVVEETKVSQTQQHLDPASAMHQRNPSSNPHPTTSSGDVSPQTYASSNSNQPSLQRNDSTQWPLSREDTGAPKTAIENLKLAAAGLNDVRDSLRGTNLTDVRDSLRGTNLTDVRDTLRDSIASGGIPLPRRNPARSSRTPQQVPPVPTIRTPIPPSRSPPPSRPPVPPIPAQMTEQGYGQSTWGEPEEDYLQSEGLRKRKSLSSMPASFSPESSGQVREKSPRLFKRSKNKKGVS